ncbi:hypothetical protein HanRHA438_Chr03g0127221 [Helianthus annuus]|uniref:Uncharacterized protein n=1 Tax=Helianthus annuus TaxID=4232 RepID=A0A251T0F3_HELAN|nr:period circadian protein [Helianthus annuus]KAF5814814.1 hypothetical protein HanXRQr2_Chr03g0115371 [Helianthus annuus]KAJ0593379.1 hypothetical protein HanHA300_Chr03g0096331 [Helianthus annuus]KAJ0601244.1 hypothetical protein HanIR_Chr03g0126161 [Helianthus annuus]KAJ0608388.1 hypothetical protein HanHA89_Chr03g0108001 [Helianthus annuus]KAJ0629622.1 hypothetical protein HanIR_Chr00c08g0906811 [Helianthus annuus]
MYSTKIGAMIVCTIRQHTLLQATIPARSGNGLLGGCFSFVSTPPPSEGGSEGVGDKAKQTMDNVLGAAKDSSQKVKDRVTRTGTGTGTGTDTGTGTGTGMNNPSKDPDMNHGVETTDSSCEDVRGRPGGYN